MALDARCRACGRLIADVRSLHVGMGRLCALRTGHVWRGSGRPDRRPKSTSPTVRAKRSRRSVWMQLDLWTAQSTCGNSNAPAGGIAEASCPQP
jgi:hypothetical protein